MKHELRHWLKKGEQAEDHKYVKREMRNGKWRYWYKTPSTKKEAKTQVNNTLNVSKVNSWINAGKNVVEKIADETSKIVERAKQNVQKLATKISAGSTEYQYFYTDKAYKNYKNGKDATDKALDIKKDDKTGALIDDVVKDANKNFVANILNSGFGKAVYDAVLPALTAIKIAAETPGSFDELKRIDDGNKSQTNEEHQQLINPNFNRAEWDYAYNCSFCTAAYDLRKRGYDVEAAPISLLEGPVVDDILSWYEGSEAVTKADILEDLSAQNLSDGGPTKALNDRLESMGDGARGNLCVYWMLGGGHSIAWEIENGSVVYRDCQTNEVYDKELILDCVRDFAYIRTDNCEITEKVLRTVRNRK